MLCSQGGYSEKQENGNGKEEFGHVEIKGQRDITVFNISWKKLKGQQKAEWESIEP